MRLVQVRSGLTAGLLWSGLREELQREIPRQLFTGIGFDDGGNGNYWLTNQLKITFGPFAFQNERLASDKRPLPRVDGISIYQGDAELVRAEFPVKKGILQGSFDIPAFGLGILPIRDERSALWPETAKMEDLEALFPPVFSPGSWQEMELLLKPDIPLDSKWWEKDEDGGHRIKSNAHATKNQS